MLSSHVFSPCTLNPYLLGPHIRLQQLQYVLDKDIVPCILTDRQRVGKHSPATQAHPTIGRLLLGHGAVNMPSKQ
jgi:hypothetical protein